ncbi:bi-domain-containing oxidoreductase [Methylocaldum gracile]|jgi:predicted dehydrogenase/threonine dehydrogenase-like Zn-dependent dehydrogenase|uniref:bi-domain-containing oxidoreductase n=1 Tax=Methylocaldum sp. 0917 TaxID=2485163 RepID=UPI001061D07A
MKQLVQNYRKGLLRVCEVPAPMVRPGGLIVASRCSLISAGTERASVRVAQRSLMGKAMERPDQARKVMDQVKKKGLVETAKLVLNRLDAPVALGYSCAGVVIEVGDEVQGFKIGDSVACAGQNYASHAEIVFVPKNLCVKLPEGVDFQDASYVALGAIALQGIRQAEPRLGETVAVIGLGLLGQLTVQLLLANGCTVIGSDPDSYKLELARESGAIAVLPEQLEEAAESLSKGQGVDASIITASAKDNGPVRAAAAVCRKRGRVIVVGAVSMNLPREPFYLKEIDLRLSTSYGPGRHDRVYEEKGVDYPYAYVRWTERRNMEAFLDLVQKRNLDLKRLTTHRFPIDRATDAYTLIMEETEPYLGIVLDYPAIAGDRPARVVELRPARSESRVRLGIIGAGNHVKDMLIPHLRGRPGVEIRAVCTGSGIGARAVADKLQAAYCSNDYEAILDDRDINAVLIGTRHDSHAAMVVKALGAGKHVFVEKPLCLDENELDGIAEVYVRAAHSGLRLMVGFNRRHSPHARKVRAHFDGRTSPLVMVYRVNAGTIDPSHWIQDRAVGGGRIIGEGCHFVDLMQSVCGSPVTTVRSVSVGYHQTGITNDQSIMTLEFADGSVGTLVYAAAGDTGLAKERFEAFGGGRAAVIDDFTSTELYSGGRRHAFRTRKQEKGFFEEMALFCASLLRPDVVLPAFDEIEAVTRACIAAERGFVTGECYPIGTTTVVPGVSSAALS